MFAREAVRPVVCMTAGYCLHSYEAYMKERSLLARNHVNEVYSTKSSSTNLVLHLSAVRSRA